MLACTPLLGFSPCNQSLLSPVRTTTHSSRLWLHLARSGADVTSATSWLLAHQPHDLPARLASTMHSTMHAPLLPLLDQCTSKVYA